MNEEQRPTTQNDAAISTNYDNQRRLILNASKLFSSTTIAAGIGLVSFVLTARTLGAEEFGALALVVTFTAVVLRLCEFQAWQALIKHAAQYQAHDQFAEVAALFRLGLFVDFTACAVAFVVALNIVDIMASIFEWQPRVLESAQIYLYVLLVSARGTPTAILRFYNRFDSIAVHHIVSALIKLIAVLIVVRMGPSFENFLFAWMISHVAEHLILLGLAARIYFSELNSNKQVSLRNVMSPGLIRFLLTSNLDSSLRMVRELDVQFVALFVDDSAAGILRVARQFAAFSGRLLDAFYTAIYPDLAHLAALGQWQSLRTFVARTSAQVGSLGLLGFAIFAVCGEWFLGWVFGEEFVAAYTVALLLLLAMVVWGFVQPLAPAVLAAGRPGYLLGAHAVAAVCYLTVLAFLAPTMGIMGAGWSLLSLYVVWGGLVFLYYRRALPKDNR